MADEKKAWEKGGPSPNPTGRPKCTWSYLKELDSQLEAVDERDPLHRTNGQIIVAKQIELAKQGSIRALNEILDRKLGKPMQPMTVDGNLTLSREERIAKLEQLLAVLPNVSDSPKPN